MSLAWDENEDHAEIRSIDYGDERIVFTIRFVPRPDVVAAVYRRARWIVQQLVARTQRLHHVLPRNYVSGESHFYLGRRHVLKVTTSAHAPAGVGLLRGRLEVATPTSDAATVCRLLTSWYRQRATEYFARRLAELAGELHWLTATSVFRLRNMRTQWGSCSLGGVLCLNPQLVKAPRFCIDYVIAHELCHLHVPNHSAAYYRLLSACMPDWEVRKQELDAIAEVVLNR